MSTYKEIVTKAVIGKGKKTTTSNFSLTPDERPNTVLGCWIINHNFKGENRGNQIIVSGNFDVNVWYSYDNDTKTAVSTGSFSYEDKMNVALKEHSFLGETSEVIVRSLRQPTVTNVEVVGNKVNMEVEKELGVEVIGETVVKVVAEEEFDDYDVIEDEVEEVTEINEEEIEKLEDEYLE